MTAPAIATPSRAIDILCKAANFEPLKQKVTLADGSDFVFYAAPLTAAERERAQKDSPTDTATDFSMQLLIAKALDENGARLFRAGDIARLKQQVEDEDIQKMIGCILNPRGNAAAEPDMKSN